LHSDGLTRAIDAFTKAHLRYVDPTLACAIVLRDAATKLDDQAVLAVRAAGRRFGDVRVQDEI
jgi:hypothetical protein